MKFVYYIAVMEMLISPLLALYWIVLAVLSLAGFINTTNNILLIHAFVSILFAYVSIMAYKILHNKILPKMSIMLARRNI